MTGLELPYAPLGSLPENRGIRRDDRRDERSNETGFSERVIVGGGASSNLHLSWTVCLPLLSFLLPFLIPFLRCCSSLCSHFSPAGLVALSEETQVVPFARQFLILLCCYCWRLCR